MAMTERHREVLNLIAQGDEVILKIEPQIVNELRWTEFISRTQQAGIFDYAVTPKGYEELKTETRA